MLSPYKKLGTSKMTFPVRRTIGYAAYFAFMAPPVGGALTWMLSFVPHAIFGSIQNGWSWEAWAGLVNLLFPYMVFSYMIGFFAAAIVGAIYGSFILEKPRKTQYIASFVAGLSVQGIFLLAFAYQTISSEPELAAIICFAGGGSAVALIAIANICFGFLRSRAAKESNPSFQRTASGGR